jgi:uncharacterized membrane protein YbjE (DUF340 family)
MSSKLKASIINLILWCIVAIGMLYIFFGREALSDWGDNQNKTLLLALLFVVGYSGQLIIGLKYRDRKNKVMKDERDLSIQNKAMSASFITTLLYIFLITISLYTKFEQAGSVPVGWLWFIAYSLVVVANISSSSFTIYFYQRGDR